MELRYICVLLFIVCMGSCDLLNNVKKKTVKLPPCDVCKKLVKSFKKGIERTSRNNFAGGDTAWEEEKLGSYHRSEVRLVEIQENLCLDVLESEGQCHSLAEEAESDLENWWFKKQDSDPDLEKWLCISTLKLCCESGHYGLECLECPNYPDAVCSGNGKCEGDGTRSGNGLCVCNMGHAGKDCKRCAEKFFEVHDGGNVICSPCHVSCQSGCSDATPKGCEACKPGWQMDGEVGCVDIDECKNSKNTCKGNTVCVNNEGSFTCQSIAHLNRRDPGKWVRYATYVSFFIATGVFFRKSLRLGSIVGLIAAVYVSASEYVMNGGHIDLSLLNTKS